MDFLKNVKLSLQASGPAAVICVWLICFTAIAIMATGENAKVALGTLGGFGGFLLVTFGSKVR
ncbi:hypothetical protein NK8_12370 [Caballeronia sp. NK8]|uniref:hypothetical protein n=1 Tax=Caballeronia sp. NK8 TaxID=140098 RepID=UPI001BB6F3D7|nr:hypothetical protein [Caballeronia sp. NK8]BCQ23112.1 hypothetical protein NK8_12370 [Caballeronia sp. NK8]